VEKTRQIGRRPPSTQGIVKPLFEVYRADEGTVITEKDRLPRQKKGDRWRVSFQYRIMRQTGPVRFSSLREAPDPAWWVDQGYAVVNCDLHLSTDGLAHRPTSVEATWTFSLRDGGVRFGWTIDEDVELTQRRAVPPRPRAPTQCPAD
jgi:hypothetical protein